MYKCRVCDSNNSKGLITAREMMFGIREQFDYEICGNCESIQIATIPDAETLQRHYPPDYYSFSGNTSSAHKKSIKSFLQDKRDEYELGSKTIIGFLFAQLKPLPPVYQLFRILSIKKDARILDIGCGGGAFLDYLGSKGFKNLHGADPFNQSELVTEHGAVIKNIDIHKIGDKFDVIMFHHALEHVIDPAADMRKARDLLTDAGICIVRIPTSSSTAWEKYKENWVQLDAPRHITIPSRKGMDILGRRAQLSLVKTIDDSTAFQFWGSEQYERDISLFRNNVTNQPGVPAFAAGVEAMNDYNREAKAANLAGRGDQAAFIYKKG